MARTGRFGRQPRSQPSLTNTLIAIAREFQNQRAANIMDAWQKGGMFEGKKATDDVVLEFWKNKMAGVSKDDPLYDTYKNAHSQLDYTIHESKMTAKYATKKASDQQMVAFYLNWAKKVPKDSEFYRVLQRDAGQYMRTAAATSTASDRDVKERRYQRQQADTRDGKEAAGEYVIETLRRLAQSGYADGHIGQAISGPGSGSDLTGFAPEDPETMLRLMEIIAPRDLEVTGSVTLPTGKARGNPNAIMHDDDGNPITGVDILRKLEKLDPNFVPGAPFNVNYVTGLLDRQLAGLNERMDRARKTGHMTDFTSLSKSHGYVALLKREAAAYPVQQAYMEERAKYDDIIEDKSTSPQAVIKARETYESVLRGLIDDPSIAADDATRSRLQAELDGTPGVPTMFESFTGLSNDQFDPASATDAQENFDQIQFLRDQVEAVATGEGNIVWAYGKLDNNGVFVPVAGGRQIGAATKEAVNAGGVNAQMVTVDDPLSGNPIQIAVTAIPIYATAKDANGDPIEGLNSNPIGWAYDTPEGSGTTTQYGFNTTEGFKFSADPPWDSSIIPTESSKDGNHLEVDFTPDNLFGAQDSLTGTYANDVIDMFKPSDLGNGFEVVVDKPGTEGQIVFNPQTTAWASGTRDGLGSSDPITDFDSITLSRLITTVEGQSILSNLDRYPSIKAQIETDNYQSSGYTKDLKTGVWMPGEAADEASLNRASNQMNIVKNANSFSEFVASAGKTWQRVTTGSIFANGKKGTASGPEATPDGFFKLATDLLRGTPFEALGSSFQPQTSTLNKPDLGGPKGVAIKTGTQIKVPSIPDVSVNVNKTETKKANNSTTKSQTQQSSTSQQQGITSSVGGQSSYLPPGYN